MKWNVLAGTIVLSASVCTQSFGLELLDRMLGVGGCCSNGCASAAPACGCDSGSAVDPGCGCDNGCAVDPACGCDSGCAPACGSCATTSCCKGGLLKRLLGNRCKRNCGSCATVTCCDSGCAADPACGCAADPACGCDAGCSAAACCSAPTCCSTKCCREGLLKRLLGNRCKRGCGSCATVTCCDSGCAADPACGCDNGCAAGCSAGCGSSAGAPSHAAGHGNAMPPAPAVDPSAKVPGKLRIMNASARTVVRG